MSKLDLEDLPNEARRRLHERVMKSGRSIEAEARELLLSALYRHEPDPEETRRSIQELQDFIDKLYGGNKPKNVVDDFIAERRREAAREAME